jgi:uncharacterized protein (TIGR02246 family)
MNSRTLSSREATRSDGAKSMRRRSLPGRACIPGIAPDPQAAARNLYELLIEAWNGHNARAFGALFRDEGVSIGFDGSQAAGDEVREHLEAVFADHLTAPYFAKVREVRALGADAALLRAIAGMVPPGGDAVNADANALHSLVAERRGEEWRIALFQNTPAQYHGRPELVESHTAEIEEVRAAGAGIG